VATTKGAAFPAWSTDGTRLAFVQRTGKKKYRLMIAAVGRANL
jgi:Tol biopolymer transport system component